MNKGIFLSGAFVALIVLASAVSFAQERPEDVFEAVCPDWKLMTTTEDKDIKTALQEYNDMLQMFIDELPTEARIDVKMIGQKIHSHCSAVAALPVEERNLFAPDIEKMDALFKELMLRHNEFAHPEETPYARPGKI